MRLELQTQRVELRELHQLSLPYIIILKSFVVNVQVLRKVIVQVSSQVAFYFFFFFSKTMCLVVKTERRWQPRAGGRSALP